MNYRLVAKVLGFLVLLVAGALFICEIYALLDEASGEAAANYALLRSGLITTAAGTLLALWGKGSGREIMRKEAVAIVGLGWFVCTFFGALPFLLCTPSLNFPAAFFESASGFTTTGSTAIADLNQFPRSILLWRAFTQWMGGMGILVLFVALLSYLGVGSKSLFRTESSAQIGYGLHSKIRDTAISLWQIYIALTFVGIIGLVLLKMPVFDAVLHTFSAISTGGFSPKNESVTFYQSAPIDAWLCVIMTLGGANFILMAWAVRRHFDKIRLDEELRAYLLILLTATLVIAADLVIRQELPWARSLQISSFQVVSIMTTTGFATADFNLWPVLSQAILVILMFVGGCSGSTSGGIKVSRIVIFGKAIGQQLIAAFRPNQVVPLKINGHTVDPAQVNSAVFFIALTGLIVALSSLLMMLLEPNLSLISNFTAVCATLFNIGPGLDAVGPMSNFASLSGTTHLFLSFLMILGRLELFAVLVLFLPALWRRY